MVIAIIITLTAVLIAIGWRRKPHRAYAAARRHDNGREILTDAEYLQELRQQARQLRCGDMTRPGVRTCKRAADRPCVPGCRGRIDITTRWTG